MAGKKKYFQEPLFDELRRDTCYVCYGRIKKDEGIYIGRNLWRHKKCKPGGRSWRNSPVGKSNAGTASPGLFDHHRD